MSGVYIICVRDPDASNEYRVFGARCPRIIDVDLGYANLRNAEEFAEWRESHLATAAELRSMNADEYAQAAARHLLEVVAQTAQVYGHAS